MRMAVIRTVTITGIIMIMIMGTTITIIRTTERR
jgi:hypothetical protein